MSHVVKTKVEMKNESALSAAIQHLGLTDLGIGKFPLFSQTVSGHGVKLPEWKYPLVIDTETGVAAYDNYGGSWGKQAELDKLVQRYCVETQYQQAESLGMRVTENVMENGDVELELEPMLAS